MRSDGAVAGSVGIPGFASCTGWSRAASEKTPPSLAVNSITEFQIAIHEAGHAAAGRLVGLPIAGSSIEFFDGHFGRTWSDESGLQPGARTVADLSAALTPLMPAIGDSRADIATELNWAINETITLLAGRAAERLFFAELLPATSHDEVEARAIAALICRSPESVDAFIAFVEVEATTLMAGHVEVVLAVANELIARRTLTGVEIDAIIGGTVRRGR
jgi:hypothetical protein